MPDKHYFYTVSGEIVVTDYWPDPTDIPCNSFFFSPNDQSIYRCGYINKNRSIDWTAQNTERLPKPFQAMLLILP